MKTLATIIVMTGNAALMWLAHLTDGCCEGEGEVQ